MERTELRLVGREDALLGRGRRLSLAAGVAALSIALLATLLGADRARHPAAVLDTAKQVLATALESGGDAPGIRPALLAIRDEIARRPLDARAKVIYAGLLLDLGTGAATARAAAFYASRAASLAPVTVPVVRPAAIVLARCGEQERAASLVRAIFSFDPRSAAALLASPDLLLDPGRREEAIPEEPEAWSAWAAQLREMGRPEEAESRLEETMRRWPDHLPTLAELAWTALGHGDWEALGKLLPRERPIPNDRSGAALHAIRARMRAAGHDIKGAIDDAKTAKALSEGDSIVLLHAGIALEDAGDSTDAKAYWEQALFSLRPAAADWLRVELLARLARLEERIGAPSDALRTWRAILDVAPDHAEAQRRVDDLTGFKR